MMSEIPYSLTRSMRRSLSIRIDMTGQVIVKAPLWLSRNRIHQWVISKTDWITKKQRQLNHLPLPPTSYKVGDQFQLLGQWISLHEATKPTRPALQFRSDAFWISPSQIHRAELLLNRWYRQFAHSFLEDELIKIALQFKIPYRAFVISNAKTTWGSCTSTQVIRLNWRLIMAPPEIIRYVICHELAHITHMNHSPRFWEWVGHMCPDWKIQRKWLKDHGHRLVLGIPRD